ncbi:HU family DNA-binding protein [Acinetobacter chinensis]|jgi:nucleoid DNA-binding protein|uniref:HU family DNA-binding protein n=1 Tax=Acinetobacter chinensis TaxID=2004650 RepID=UPI0029343ED9|nr:HU family DNA-binding protein [Acinetobacter chinensis]WOE42916.1 HU family DNA-binding protein [Acinetobacter chinensis]
MTKSELIKQIAERAELTQAKAAEALQAFEAVVMAELKSGNEVALTGFGTFKVTDRAARTGRNPQTGAEIQIAASKSPTFKAGKALKEAVNQ